MPDGIFKKAGQVVGSLFGPAGSAVGGAIAGALGVKNKMLPSVQMREATHKTLQPMKMTKTLVKKEPVKKMTMSKSLTKKKMRKATIMPEEEVTYRN